MNKIYIEYIIKSIIYIIMILIIFGLFIPKKLIVYHLSLCLIILFLIDNNTYINKNNIVLQQKDNIKLLILFSMGISIFNYISKYNINLLFTSIINWLDDCLQITNDNELTLKYKFNVNTQEIPIQTQTTSSVSPLIKFYESQSNNSIKNFINTNKL